MSHWIRCHHFQTGETKSLAFVVLPPGHSRRWRLIYKILKTFQACPCCSEKGDLFLSQSATIPYEMEKAIIKQEVIDDNMNTEDKTEIEHDLNRHNIEFIQGNIPDLCLLCSMRYVIPWNHFHADMHLLEIVHKEILWVCIGQQRFYSGWLHVREQSRRRVAVLYQVDMASDVISYVMGQFVTDAENKEINRIVTTPVDLDPALMIIFKSFGHRPFPKLLDAALPVVLENSTLHTQLPETLKERYSELGQWMKYFG